MVANLFFIDYEATGHNPYFDTITEVAIKKIFTDDYYQSLVIPDEKLSWEGPPQVIELSAAADTGLVY